MKLVKSIAGAVTMFMVFGTALATDYTVTVEPNLPPAQVQATYKPLMDYLSKETGHNFILKPTANYHVYWRDLRSAAPTDFAFEDAHFTEFRINRQHFTPLARILEPTRFVLLADPKQTAGTVTGLIGHRIASMSAPSLGYLVLSDMYKNPISQPEFQSVAPSWKASLDQIQAGRAEAAMVPSQLIPANTTLVTVATSRNFLGRAFTAAPTVPADVRKKVANALLYMPTNKPIRDALLQLGGWQWVAATPGEYAGNERMLRDVFGYQAMPAKSGSRTAATTTNKDPETGGLQVKADKGN